MTSNRQIEIDNLTGVMDVTKSQTKSELNCIMIGTIVKFDPLEQTVNVTINYQKVLKQRNSEGENKYTDVIISYPVLVRCPLIILNGGGAYLTFPVLVGDTCIILFCDRDMDTWFKVGSDKYPPNSERIHDLSDGIALIGINSLKTSIENYNAIGMQLKDSRIYIDGSLKVTTGATGSFVAGSGHVVTVIDGIVVGIA